MENQQDNDVERRPWNGGSIDDSGIDTLRDADNRRKSNIPTLKYRASYDDLLLGDARLNRIAQAEAIIRQDMFKECTFRPEIISLPSSYGAMKGADTPFHDRVTKWQRERDMEIKNKAHALQKSEVADCTFHPKINRNSDRAIREIRGNNTEETANDRLYKSANLYNEQRYKLIEDERQKENLRERSECTFQPQLIASRNRLYSQVNSKVNTSGTPHKTSIHRQRSQGSSNMSSNNSQQDQGSSRGLSKDHTFTPKINKIKPHMSSAKLYVSTNVVDRLTRPVGGAPPTQDDSALRTFDGPPGDESRVMDMATFMGGLLGGGGNDGTAGGSNSGNISVASSGAAGYMTPGARPSSARLARRASTGTKQRPHGLEGGLELSQEERQLKFEQFLERQRQVTKRKEDKVQQISRAMTPKFKPKLVTSATTGKDKNAPTTESTEPVTVFDRLERHVQRRQQSEQAKEVVVDENCTFTPRINKNAEKLRPRSSFEMSRGDLLKKETNRRMLKLQTEQEELSNMTFAPKISHYAKESGAKSVLQLSTDPSQFLDWYQSKNAERESERAAELKRREDEEIARCTFSPKTIDCPAYVRRIAKSMAVVKAARGADGGAGSYAETAKAQWR